VDNARAVHDIECAEGPPEPTLFRDHSIG